MILLNFIKLIKFGQGFVYGVAEAVLDLEEGVFQELVLSPQLFDCQPMPMIRHALKLVANVCDLRQMIIDFQIVGQLDFPVVLIDFLFYLRLLLNLWFFDR